MTDKFLIYNFCCVLNVVFFLLGDTSSPDFYVLTFRNTLFDLYRRCLHRLWRWNHPKERIHVRQLL